MHLFLLAMCLKLFDNKKSFLIYIFSLWLFFYTSRNAFNHELTVLAKARHPNIVQFVGAVTQNLPMMIVVEHNPRVSIVVSLLHFMYAHGITIVVMLLIFQGDLSEYLQKKGRLSPSKALRFALDIARGMNYLHECKPDPFIHCDLRPK